MHKLGHTLSLIFKGQSIDGSIIGIDSYVMNNFEGHMVKWTSYTLVSHHKGVLSRFWVVNRGKHGWFISLPSKKKILPKTAHLALERSGLAQIDFLGDKGPSTPSAALLAYRLQKDRYYTIECFSKFKAMYFDGYKIQKPKISKKKISD